MSGGGLNLSIDGGRDISTGMQISGTYELRSFIQQSDVTAFIKEFVAS
jgi:hypothetical protein